MKVEITIRNDLDDTSGSANGILKNIIVPPIRNRSCLYVWLHELGHIDYYNRTNIWPASGYDSGAILIHEMEAWLFVFQHINKKHHGELLKEASKAFGTYLKKYGQGNNKTAKSMLLNRRSQ